MDIKEEIKEKISKRLERNNKDEIFVKNGYLFHSEMMSGGIGISNKKYTIMSTPFLENTEAVSIEIYFNEGEYSDLIESYDKSIPFELNKKNENKIINYYFNEVLPDAIKNAEMENKENFSEKLVGKKIKLNNEKERKITKIDSNSDGTYVVYMKNSINPYPFNEIQLNSLVNKGYAKSNDRFKDTITLIDFKPSKPKTINQPEYKYYIVSKSNNKIVEGFEFKEDAKERLQEIPVSVNGMVVSKRDLRFSPDDDSNWGNPVDVNSDVIERANKYYENYVSEEIGNFFKSVGLEQPKEKPSLTEKQILELYSECLLKKIKSSNYYKLNKTGDILFNEYNKVRETISQL